MGGPFFCFVFPQMGKFPFQAGIFKTKISPFGIKYELKRTCRIRHKNAIMLNIPIFSIYVKYIDLQKTKNRQIYAFIFLKNTICEQSKASGSRPGKK